MSKVLVTGFGPYGVTPVNPAQLTAEELDGRTIAGATVISRIVPNTFFESIAAAQQAIAEIEPALTPPARSPTTRPYRFARWCWPCERPACQLTSRTRRARSCAITSCTACCTTSPRRVCPSAPVGFICRACPASPHWITTSVFRACRSRRRSPGSRLASRQPFGSPQISANRSRRDCRSRAQLTAVF